MTVRLGVLAASRIATRAVFEPLEDLDGVTVTAIAARDPERARDVARTWEIPTVCDSYADLIRSDQIDAVYVGTPAALHRPWAVAAIEAGLHVLCEKPLAANAEDAASIAAAAASSDRVVMEGFHWRYHPFADDIRAGLDRIGPPETIDAWLELEEGRIAEGDIRWDLRLGGGSTMDLGCYAISWVRWAIGAEPEVVAASARSTTDGVDAWLTAELKWPRGITGRIHSSMVAPVGSGRGSGMTVTGRDGTLRVENPLAPQRGSQLTLENADGIEVRRPDRSTTFLHQMAAFRDAIESGTRYPTTVSDGVANMAVIDACYRAAGLPVRPTYPD